MQLPAIPGWGLVLMFVGGPSPILAEGPGAIPCHSWLGLLLLVVGVSFPILAEGPVCNSPPFLAGAFCRCLLVVPRQSWPWVQCPAIPSWGLLLAVAGGPSPILAEGAGPGSAPFLAGICCRWWRVVPPQSWLRALGIGPRHSWLGALGVVPRHSWPGSAVWGRWSCSLCVRGVRLVLSRFVLCRVVFVVPFVVPSVCVTVLMWRVCPRCVSGFVCV